MAWVANFPFVVVFACFPPLQQALFVKRNYVTAELHKCYKNIVRANRDPPTVEMLVKCLRRDIVTEDDFECFEFYWEEILPRAVGANVWSDYAKYYSTISEAMRLDRPQLACVSAQDEAFAVVCIENQCLRWIEDAKREIKETGVVDGVEENSKKANKSTEGLYTSSKKGQNRFGGWSEEGLSRYNNFKEYNKQARLVQKEVSKEERVEEICLRRLREKKGITMNDYKEQKAWDESRKRRKSNGGDHQDQPVKKKVIVATMAAYESSDDEDEFHDVTEVYKA